MVISITIFFIFFDTNLIKLKIFHYIVYGLITAYLLLIFINYKIHKKKLTNNYKITEHNNFCNDQNILRYSYNNYATERKLRSQLLLLSYELSELPDLVRCNSIQKKRYIQITDQQFEVIKKLELLKNLKIKTIEEYQ